MAQKKPDTCNDTVAIFNANGYLDPGFHLWNIKTVHRHFVELVPQSSTRTDIFSGFKELRSCFSLLNLNVEHWIDGSFTSTKENPSDIDVANFFDPNEVDAIPAEMESVFNAYVSGKATRSICHCDSYFALKVPDDHPLRDHFEKAYNYWLDHFGSDRSDVPKGIVVTPLTSQPTTTEITDVKASAPAT